MESEPMATVEWAKGLRGARLDDTTKRKTVTVCFQSDAYPVEAYIQDSPTCNGLVFIESAIDSEHWVELGEGITRARFLALLEGLGIEQPRDGGRKE